jgi:hypothetical protein
LAGAALLEQFRSADPYSLPFEPRVATTGQEDTELLQALDAAGIVPATELSVKRPHLADANLDACLVDQVERLVRHHDAAAVLAIGCSATAWAAAVSPLWAAGSVASGGSPAAPLVLFGALAALTAGLLVAAQHREKRPG